MELRLLIFAFLLFYSDGVRGVGPFQYSPLEYARKDRSLDDLIELTDEEINVAHDVSYNSLYNVMQINKLGYGPRETVRNNQICQNRWRRIPGYRLRQDLENGTELVPGLPLEKRKQFEITMRYVYHINLCARRCLLGSACDMFSLRNISWLGEDFTVCIHYPHLKLKTRKFTEVADDMAGDSSHGVFVLECDDSQANVLPAAFTNVDSLEAGWTETHTGTEADTYLATRHDQYFRNRLPACDKCHESFPENECIYNGYYHNDNVMSKWSGRAKHCYKNGGSLITFSNQAKYEKTLALGRNQTYDGTATYMQWAHTYPVWTAGRANANGEYSWMKGPGYPPSTPFNFIGEWVAGHPIASDGYGVAFFLHTGQWVTRSMSNIATWNFCEKLRDITGLGGEVEGHHLERAVLGGAISYTLTRQIQESDLGASLDYIKTFQPNGLVKVWARFHFAEYSGPLNPPITFTETATFKVTFNGVSKEITITLDSITQSSPLALGVVQFPTAFPAEFKLEVTSAFSNGFAMFTPPQILVDQPFNVGCFKAPPDASPAAGVSTAEDCLVSCKTASADNRFGHLSKDGCICLTEAQFEVLEKLPDKACSHCAPGADCGGIVYTAECPPDFLRFGAFCHIMLDPGFKKDLEEKCIDYGGHLWAPRGVGDYEWIKEAFQFTSVHAGVESLEPNGEGLRLITGEVMPGEYPLFYGPAQNYGQKRVLWQGNEPLKTEEPFPDGFSLPIDSMGRSYVMSDAQAVPVQEADAGAFNGVCQVPLVYGIGNMMKSPGLGWRFNDLGVEKLLVGDEAILEGLPGIPIYIELLRGSDEAGFFEVEFNQNIVLYGIEIRSAESHYIRRVRYHARIPDPDNYNRWQALSTEPRGYRTASSGVHSKFSIRLDNPIMANGIRIDLSESAPQVKLRLRVLAMTIKSLDMDNYLLDGELHHSGRFIGDTPETLWVNGSFCPRGGIHLAGKVLPAAASVDGAKITLTLGGSTFEASLSVGPDGVGLRYGDSAATPDPPITANETVHLYVTCDRTSFKLYLNNKLIGEQAANHGSGPPTVVNVIVERNAAGLDNVAAELVEANQVYSPYPDDTGAIGCVGLKCMHFMENHASFIELFESGDKKEVQFIIGSPEWKCSYSVTHRFNCYGASFKWSASKQGGLAANMVCPATGSNVALGLQCASPVTDKRDFDTATSNCKASLGDVLVPSSVVQSQILSIYSRAKGSGSFWIGARKMDGKWIKPDGRPLSPTEVDIIEDPNAVGDCLVIDPSAGRKAKAVDCSESHSYFCSVGPKCPPGYEWVPELSRTCLKIGARAGANFRFDYYSAQKVCLRDNTRLATPHTHSAIKALRDWLNRTTTSYDNFEVTLGWKKVTLDASYYRSPFKNMLFNETFFNNLVNDSSITSDCVKITEVRPKGTFALAASDCLNVGGGGSADVRPICQYTECMTTDNKICSFPFRYKGRMYDTCITSDSKTGPWCSLKRDRHFNHIDAPENRGTCSQSCFVHDCPVGFHNGNGENCLHYSGRTQNDAWKTAGDVNAACNAMGARLYQPRDYANLSALTDESPSTFFKPMTVGHYATSFKSIIMIGVNATVLQPNVQAVYGDGTRAYMIEKRLLSFPTTSPTISDLSAHSGDACVGIDAMGAIVLTRCDGYYTPLDNATAGPNQMNLGYICEVKLFKTIDGPDKDKACVIPFRATEGGKLEFSCHYENETTDPWCATQVNENLTVVDRKYGLCKDERKITYRGQGSGGYCQIPFVYDGIWRETCVEAPRRELWCPTETTKGGVFNETAHDFGYCTEFFKPTEADVCPEYYEVVGDICVRVSPYPETFDDAQLKCQSEGGYLLIIDNEEITPKLLAHVKSLASEKIYYLPKYSPDTSSYWIGGEAKDLAWSWVGNKKNFSAYSNWKDGIEFIGCIQLTCTDNYALSIDSTKLFAWKADDRAKAKPYVCQFNCPLGYKFLTRIQKCVKIYKEAKKASEAMLTCSKTKSRLVQISECDQIGQLAEDIYWLQKNENYEFYLGYFKGATANNLARRLGEPYSSTVTSSGFTARSDCTWLSGLADVSLMYLEQTAAFPNDTAVKAEAIAIVDSSAQRGFLCEHEFDWRCPDGYLMFYEDCYKILEGNFTHPEADLQCRLLGADMLDARHELELNFFSHFFPTNNITGPVWLTYRSGWDDATSLDFYSLTQEGIATFPAADQAGEGACLSLLPDMTYERSDCQLKKHVVCQKPQEANKDLEEVIFKPSFFLPLDNLTVLDSEESNIAFPDEPVFETEMGSYAAFPGEQSAFIEVPNNKNFTFGHGMTLSFWLRPTKTPGAPGAALLDFANDLEDKYLVLTLGADLKVSAYLCNSKICNATATETSFHALTENVWNFVAFTYDVRFMKGTFYVGEKYGAGSSESSHFTFDTDDWFSTTAVKGPLTIGKKRFSASVESFEGHMSCLQMFTEYFKVSQVYKLSKTCFAPPGYPRVGICPRGFLSLYGDCFRPSDKPKTYAEAEVECLKYSSFHFPSVLAYSKVYHIQEFLSSHAKKVHNVTEIWYGIDSRSQHPVDTVTWRNSWGDTVADPELNWADGQPVAGADNCGVLDHTQSGKWVNRNCSETRHFYCLRPKTKQIKCPKNHIFYKGECLFKSNPVESLIVGKDVCSAIGGFVLPIKTKGMFEFIKVHAASVKAGNIYLGVNFTQGAKRLYLDGTEYTNDSYGFDGNDASYGGKQCVILKRGIGFLPRESTCDVLADVYCIWRAPTCPEGYTMYRGAANGRTCYSLSSSTSKFEDADCSRPGSFLERLGLPDDGDAIDIAKPNTSYAYIDAYTTGNTVWSVTMERHEGDFDSPIDIQDYSKERSWSGGALSSGYSLIDAATAEELKFKESICSSTAEKFILQGTFNTKKLATNNPVIKIPMDKTNENIPLKWTFYKAGSTNRELNSSFVLSNVVNGEVVVKKELVLDGFDLETASTFNVTISCDSQKFTVVMDGKWSDTLDYNGTVHNLTEVTTLHLLGAYRIDFAGYGGEGCLMLSQHGRVIPGIGEDCDQDFPSVCEYKSCYTKDGSECIFPFTYKGVEYRKCAVEDVYLPWCATGINSDNLIESWGLCLDDCPMEPVTPVCIHPPPIPNFGIHTTGDVEKANYVANWFNLTYLEEMKLVYNVSRNTTFRYRPHEYNPDNTSQFIVMELVHNREDLHLIYEDVPENGTANYTCPIGFVFEGTHNITFTQRCLNWTWTWDAQFDVTKSCVPVFCNESEVPMSPANSTNATNNYLERKEEDPLLWNAYLARLTYECPEGYVIDLPGMHNETVTSFEVYCDSEAYWRPNLTHTQQPNPRTMPPCVPINCTQPPFQARMNDFGMMNWTEVYGNARPYDTVIHYTCPRPGWGYPSTGENLTVARCGLEGTWNVTSVETCVKLPCPDSPPPAHEGEGAERVYGLDSTRYRCPNGHMFTNGDFPYWYNECLPTKKWEHPKDPLSCIKRRCEGRPPMPFSSMEVIWPYKINELGDKITYRCPNGKYLDDVPLPPEGFFLDGMSWSDYGTMSTPLRDQIVECIWSNDTSLGHNDSMIWYPAAVRECKGVIPPPEDVVVLPTNAPYAVDYPSTTSYYWPHVSDNISMISIGGLASYQEEPVSGPFGFGPAHKLLKDKCVIDGDFSFDHDDCIKNPINCQHGLSFSIWEKVDHPRYVLELDPTTTVYPKKYVFSTGGDYDGDKTVPGFAVFHQGLNVIALLSTGEDVWEVNVQGSFKNNSFSNIGVRWAQPTTDPQVIDPNQFGGLELYVDLEKVGHSIYPMERPASGWTALPPVSLDAQDPSGALIPGKKEGPAVMMFGCHYDQIEGGADVSPPKFGGYLNGVLDEMAIWTRKLVTNKTVDETLYFLGGYVSQLEDMSSEKFAELLKKVDMSDPDQAAAAGSMANTLFSNQPPEEDAADSGNLSAPEDPDSPYPKPTTWKEIEKYKQLKLADTYKGILDMVGAVPGSLPHHIDARFETITVASQILSCTQKNRQRWKIVQEDGDQPGSSEIVTTIEDYAMEYMLSSNINHYDDTKYFNSSTHHYNVNLETESMFMSVQKMYMDRYIRKSKTYFDPKANVNRSEPMYNVQAYREPRDKWSMARALWPSPTDEIYLPNRIFNDYPECWQNPVTFMYAIYPCYGDYAPLRRSMVTIRANRFVVDSKVISVKFHLSNDTAWKEAVYGNCSALTENMRYNPVRVKFFHKSKETSRRKLMFHDDEIKTSIEVRRCVRWNEDIGRFGAWDADRSKTVMTELDSTICEFATFGTYAVIAEKIEKPIGRRTYTWLNVSKYIGFVISIISLLFFILVIMTSPHLWEMFHLIRLNTGLCYLFALTFHFVAELKQVQEDRHYNAAIASCLVFFYLSGSFFQMLEAFAEFRAITSGVVGGKTAAYIPLGWAGGFACLGLTWFMYGTDVGTDPNVFIGWNNETKLPFYAMNYFALGSALILSSIIIINASSPQTRKADVVEDLQLQGQGLAITNFFFVVVWAFAYPAFMKFPGVEMREFYPVFSIFNAWQGLIILIFLGFSSKKFRYVLSRCFKKKGSKHRAPEDQQPIVVESAVTTAPGTPASSRPGSAVEEDPVESRPGSGTSKAGDEEEGGSRPTSATTLPGTVENDEEEEEEEEAGEENDGEDDEEPEEEAEEEEGENEDNKEEE